MHGKLVRADNQHLLCPAGLDLPGRHRQGVDKARAGRIQIESTGAGRPQPVLHQRGRGGHDLVGRAGGVENQVDIVPVDAGDVERGPRGLH